jgi:hypothetical protein
VTRANKKFREISAFAFHSSHRVKGSKKGGERGSINEHTKNTKEKHVLVPSTIISSLQTRKQDPKLHSLELVQGKKH